MDCKTAVKRFDPVSRRDETVQGEFSGERALYGSAGLKIRDSVFLDGESPLKESRDIEVTSSEFRYKYPLWYCRNVKVSGTTWQELGRSGVWYTDGISVKDCVIHAPKNFRRCRDVSIEDTLLDNAQETLWTCDGVTLKNVRAKGDYFGMNSSHVRVDGLELDGNYAFDGGRDIEVRNSRLTSKDCFWNCENVTVYDSYIDGEYLAWNTRNITFVNCTIRSNQGLCYIDGLKMVHCRLVDTKLAFERCYGIDAEIDGHVDSVLNPGSGRIVAGSIWEKIIEPDNCDPSATEIVETGKE